jgi:hypothetical protein
MIAPKSFITLKRLITPVRRSLSSMSDPILGWTIAVATLLVLNGLWWGWVESWDPDQVALRSLIIPGYRLLEPQDFVKAPFATYFNFLLSVLPIKTLERLAEVVSGTSLNFEVAILWWSRLIHLGLFLGTIVCAYQITARASGRSAARIVGIAVATSAGLVLRAHYLTEDIPVTFWMLASFLAGQYIIIRGRTGDYVLAGVLAGVAAATKYNGLAIALAIPIFHYSASRSLPLKRVATDTRLIVALLSVVVAFVAANPYSVIDFEQFGADVVYGFATLSYYHTEVGEANYLLLPLRIVEIVGWPIALMAGIAACVSSASIRKSSSLEVATMGAALAVFLLYAIIPVRFLAPAVPFLLIAGGLSVPQVAYSRLPFRHAATAVLAAALIYNVVASAWVGYTFASDPRLAAHAWVASHVPPGSEIESTAFAPHWNGTSDIDIKDVRMPFLTGRNRLFSRLYSDSAGVVATIDQKESDADVAWYNAGALRSRRPDYIVLDWLYYGRFLAEPVGPLYPEIRAYFRKLLDGQLGYKIVFDQSLPPAPHWLYPQDIGFVEIRTVILRRSDQALTSVRPVPNLPAKPTLKS